MNQDPILPIAIEHRYEEILDGDRPEQIYNYLVYHFESDGAYFWARSYLDDIGTVSLHGPFASRISMTPTGGPLPAPVLTYLRRRFRTVQMLRGDGYAPI